MTTVKSPVAVAATFLWIGFVCAISFMEAWLKFRAPGITLPLGLGIGRIVFNVLNKVEWVLAIALFVNLLLAKEPVLNLKNMLLLIPMLLLLAQTIWLLPALDIRAEQYIQGAVVPPSSLHLYYVGMETLKTLSLFIYGLSLFKSTPLNRLYHAQQ